VASKYESTRQKFKTSNFLFTECITEYKRYFCGFLLTWRVRCLNWPQCSYLYVTHRIKGCFDWLAYRLQGLMSLYRNLYQPTTNYCHLQTVVSKHVNHKSVSSITGRFSYTINPLKRPPVALWLVSQTNRHIWDLWGSTFSLKRSIIVNHNI
jgi:hypothetical protein